MIPPTRQKPWVATDRFNSIPWKIAKIVTCYGWLLHNPRRVLLILKVAWCLWKSNPQALTSTHIAMFRIRKIFPFDSNLLKILNYLVHVTHHIDQNVIKHKPLQHLISYVNIKPRKDTESKKTGTKQYW